MSSMFPFFYVYQLKSEHNRLKVVGSFFVFFFLFLWNRAQFHQVIHASPIDLSELHADLSPHSTTHVNQDFHHAIKNFSIALLRYLKAFERPIYWVHFLFFPWKVGKKKKTTLALTTPRGLDAIEHGATNIRIGTSIGSIMLPHVSLSSPPLNWANLVLDLSFFFSPKLRSRNGPVGTYTWVSSI